MNIWRFAFRMSGWKFDVTTPMRDKCVICVAPHTSNWDFILGLLAYRSLGRKANFLMKKFWFFFPLKYLLTSLGGIPVPPKSAGGNLTASVIKRFENSSYMNLAVTPEGTRSRTEKWRTGFLYIAWGAKVPIQLAVIDYSRRIITISEEFIPSGNIEKDMEYVRNYYSAYKNAAKYPDKFFS